MYSPKASNDFVTSWASRRHQPFSRSRSRGTSFPATAISGMAEVNAGNLSNIANPSRLLKIYS